MCFYFLVVLLLWAMNLSFPLFLLLGIICNISLKHIHLLAIFYLIGGDILRSRWGQQAFEFSFSLRIDAQWLNDFLNWRRRCLRTSLFSPLGFLAYGGRHSQVVLQFVIISPLDGCLEREKEFSIACVLVFLEERLILCLSQ